MLRGVSDTLTRAEYPPFYYARVRSGVTLLLALMVAVLTAAMPVSAGMLTLSFTDASWNDGGSLSGTFTVDYDANGMPTSLVSADVVTGDGTSDGFIGQSYIFDVNG